MSTIDGGKSSISVDAYEILSSLHDGIEKSVREIAEILARKRGSIDSESPDLAAVEVEDVLAAAGVICQALEHLTEGDDVQGEVRQAIKHLRRHLHEIERAK